MITIELHKSIKITANVKDVIFVHTETKQQISGLKYTELNEFERRKFVLVEESLKKNGTEVDIMKHPWHITVHENLKINSYGENIIDDDDEDDDYEDGDCDCDCREYDCPYCRGC